MAYTITNPKIGRQIVQAKYQSWQDSGISCSIMRKKSQLDDIIKALFPEFSYSIENFGKGTDKSKSTRIITVKTITYNQLDKCLVDRITKVIVLENTSR